MAEAYKGLTIRIGADTTDFSRKLQSMGTAISATQAGLKQMNKALQNNPQSVDAMNQRLTLTQNHITNLNAKLNLVRNMLRQMDERGIGELAAQTQDTAMQARLLTDRLNQVNKSLEQEHVKMEQLGNQLGIAYDKTKPDEFRKAVEAATSKMTEENVQAKATYDMLDGSIRKLSNEHHKLEAQLDSMKEADAYKSLQRDAVALNAEIVKTYQDLARFTMAMPSEGEVQRLNKLETEFSELDADMQATSEQARALKSSLYLDPKNPEKFDAAVEAVYHQMELTAKQADNLKARIKLIGDTHGIDKVEKSLSEAKAEVREANDHFEATSSVLAKVKAKINTLEDEMKGYKNATREGADSITENERAARKLEERIKKLQAAEEKLTRQAKVAGENLQSAKAREQMKQLEIELDKTNAKMQKFANTGKQATATMLNGLRDMATSLGATVAPAIAMVSSKVISSADTIDAAYRDMRKTVEGTEQQFESLKAAAIEFSRTHPVSADTILEIEAIGGQLGITVDKLEGFAHVVSNLDIATNMDAEDIALDLGKLANIFSDLGWNTEKFGDSLVRLGNNTAALESDIMNITTRFAGMSAIVGVLPDEVLAIATASSATGQKADAAGGSLQRTFGRIEGAVAGVSDAMMKLDDLTEDEIQEFEDAKDALKDYADIAGMSAEEFAKYWKSTDKVSKDVSGLNVEITGATYVFKRFIEGLREIDKSGGSVDATLQKLKITGVRDRQLLEGLTNTTDVLNNALNMSSDAWNGVKDQWGAAGDAAREAGKKAEGFSGKLATLKNIVQTLGSAFGDKLVPLLDMAIGALQAVTVVIDNMPAPVASLLALMSAFLIAFPPILRNFAQFKLTMDAVTTSNLKASVAQKATNIAISEGLIAQKYGIKTLGDFGARISSMKEQAVKSVKSLGALKLGLAGLAATAAVVAVVAIAKLIKKEIEFTKATVGLKGAVLSTSKAMGEYNSSIAEATMVYYGAKGSVDEYITHLASLRDELLEIGRGASSSASVLKQWGEVAKENISVSKDDKLAVEKQKLAVETLNEQYGLGLQIKEEDGKLSITNKEGNELVAASIDEIVAAKKREIEISAYAEQLKKLEQEKADAAQQVADATRGLSEAQMIYNQAVKDGVEDLRPYQQQVDEAEETLRRAEAAQNAVNDSAAIAEERLARKTAATNGEITATERVAEANENLANVLDGISLDTLPQFAKAIEEEGISVDDLSKLTSADIADIATSWQSGTKDWVDVIKKANSETKTELDSSVTQAEDSGRNFGLGYYNGIDKMIEKVKEKAAELVREAIKAANKEAVVKSPSRKTAWTGRMIGQGYIVGMKEEEDAVQKQGAILGALATGYDAYSNSASLGYLSGMTAGSFGSVTTNNSTHDTRYILSGDINITTQSGDPQEIVNEIVRVFTVAQNAYA